MSWADPCGNCGEHRADCACHLDGGGFASVATTSQEPPDSSLTYEEVLDIMRGDSGDWRGDNTFQGLVILAKYFNANDTAILDHAEHGQIWSVGIQEAIEAGITREDVKELRRLNWMESQEAFSCFV